VARHACLTALYTLIACSGERDVQRLGCGGLKRVPVFAAAVAEAPPTRLNTAARSSGMLG
jgi:hypothetical protein